jgi:hypothetical protein
VHFFNLVDHIEILGDAILAFFLGVGDHLRIHLGELVGFAFDGGLEVGGGVADLSGIAEVGMGMDGFSFGGGAEQLGNLRQAFLVSLFGESEILAVSLRFSSESVHQILFGLAHGKSPLGIIRLCRVCCLRSQSGTIPVYKNPALL